jgi:hypothetical protein
MKSKGAAKTRHYAGPPTLFHHHRAFWSARLFERTIFEEIDFHFVVVLQSERSQSPIASARSRIADCAHKFS